MATKRSAAKASTSRASSGKTTARSRSVSQDQSSGGTDPASLVEKREQSARRDATPSDNRFKTYKAKGETKAYKVTAEEGETIVTSNGAVHAPKGSYVVLDESTPGQTSHSVRDAESFEAAHNV